MCASASVVSTPGNQHCTLTIALHDHLPSAELNPRNIKI